MPRELFKLIILLMVILSIGRGQNLTNQTNFSSLTDSLQNLSSLPDLDLGIILGISAAIIIYFVQKIERNKERKEDLSDLKKEFSNMREFFECDLNNRVSNGESCLKKYNITLEEAMQVAENALQIAKNHYDKGLAYAFLNNFTEAESEFSEAIELHPNNSKYYFARGNSRYSIANFKEACADYSKSIDIKPDDAGAWSNKGVALGKLDRLEEALECFDKALEIKPNLAEAWSNKGNALDHLGRLEESFECFDKAKNLESSR